MMKSIITVIASLIVGVVAMYMYGEVRDGYNTETNVTINSIKKIAELATVEYNMSVIVERTKKKKKFLEWKKAKFLVLLSGKVKGSVDLNSAKININKESNTVDIAFAKKSVKVSNPEIPPKGLKIITVSNPNLFNKLKDSDFTKGQEIAIKKLRQSALDNDIINKTKNEAVVVLSNFLEALGYKSKIVFL